MYRLNLFRLIGCVYRQVYEWPTLHVRPRTHSRPFVFFCFFCAVIFVVCNAKCKNTTFPNYSSNRIERNEPKWIDKLNKQPTGVCCFISFQFDRVIKWANTQSFKTFGIEMRIGNYQSCYERWENEEWKWSLPQAVRWFVSIDHSPFVRSTSANRS